MVWEEHARVKPLHARQGFLRHEGQRKRPQRRLLREKVVAPGVHVGALCNLLGCRGWLGCCRRSPIVTSGGRRERRQDGAACCLAAACDAPLPLLAGLAAAWPRLACKGGQQGLEEFGPAVDEARVVERRVGLGGGAGAARCA